jgi:hypothetical protein
VIHYNTLGDTLNQFLAQIPETPLKTLLITTLNDKEEPDQLDILTFQNDPFNSLNHYDGIAFVTFLFILSLVLIFFS